ncbi:solute carrier family 25 member 45 isoform X2 [Alligator mississippiensis]|uniref:Solute carrier family 25 member 45 n=1 Tax=Alligator mississippiensis TaxID=8496 RepID=A0A151P0U3_ALLMI|nr:solute carrier family 25 member 45 isoform X2 [Alligator mississippiensis]KYO42664.1 solute carrier family 25 member 45 [Alligator mississippiensis]
MAGADFVAGWISGALGLAVGHPMDTVKVRLQARAGYRGALDCVLRTYREETVLGFFKGMSFPLLSVALVNAVMFGTYGTALRCLGGPPRPDRGASAPPARRVLAAGCCAGLAQAVVLAPVDLIKVRLQSQTHGLGRGGPAEETRAPRYRGPVHCAACILREEGPRGLLRGAGALALRDTPTSGLYFLLYASLSRGLTPSGQEPGACTVLLAGGVAGSLSWACATPMDVVKVRLQAGGSPYRGILHCARLSARQEGARVFLRGLGLNCARAFPVNAVTFFGYENILRIIT